MTLNELRIINTVLDSRPVYGLPTDGVKLTPIVTQSIKKAMIRKNLLRDENTFAHEGLVQAQRLRLYKAASLYIALNQGMIIGCGDGEDVVALLHNPLRQDYHMVRLQAAHLPQQVLDMYPFLAEVSVSAPAASQRLTERELRLQYSLTLQNSLKLITRRREEKADKTLLFFKHENALYCYNPGQLELRSIAPQEAMRVISERLTVPNN